VRITVDRDKCIASGACVIAAPELFDQDEDGIVVVLDENPDGELAAKAVEAAQACPAAVIWTDDQ
jgi:ferredoxin